MANAHIKFTEVRFLILDDRTQVFVHVAPAGPIEDIPFQALGWHFAYFDATFSLMDIMESWKEGHFNPILWPTMEPPL